MARYDFASDNTAPAAPEAIEALVRANAAGFTPGYGADPVTAAAAEAVRKLLDVDAEVRFVAS
ncbi:MAG: low specificity L-threonine aldolase, partial [Phenylobacterium sp.]